MTELAEIMAGAELVGVATLRDMMLECMTWPRLAALQQEGCRRVVVPLGSIEQHGPRLPFVTDTLIASAVALGVAARLGQTIVGPVVRPGYSPHHMHFPGSLSVESELLVDQVRAYCANLAANGFDEFCILSGHGGNFAPVRDCLSDLRRDLGIRIGHALDLEVYTDAMMAPIRARRMPTPSLNHADSSEQSLIMYLAPWLVADGDDQPGLMGEIDLADIIARGIRAVSPSGILGDPRGSTAEIGREVYESIVEHVVTAFRDTLE